MHGIIFAELRKYVDARIGPNGWPTLLAEAGKRGVVYLPSEEYADAEAVALVMAASRVLGMDSGAILEDFGAFIVPDLVRLYSALLDPRWSTLDVIEHTEATIHRVVRLANRGAKPPELVCRRPSRDEVEIEYRSKRRMCGIAKGIVQGLAKHFGEQVTITETACMQANAEACVICVKQIAAA